MRRVPTVPFLALIVSVLGVDVLRGGKPIPRGRVELCTPASLRRPTAFKATPLGSVQIIVSSTVRRRAREVLKPLKA